MRFTPLTEVTPQYAKRFAGDGLSGIVLRLSVIGVVGFSFAPAESGKTDAAHWQLEPIQPHPIKKAQTATYGNSLSGKF